MKFKALLISVDLIIRIIEFLCMRRQWPRCLGLYHAVHE